MRIDAHWERLLASGHIPGDLEAHVRHHYAVWRQDYAVWRQAADRVRALDLTLGTKAKERREVVKRLETVPGVGPIVALTTIAVFAEVGRFPSAKQAASYSGLVPSTFQSGDRDAHGRITKRGSAELRTMPCDSVRETETGNPSESVSEDAINERAHAHPRRSGTRSLLRGSLCTQNYGSRRSALPSGCPTSLPFRRAPSRSLGPWDPSAGSTCNSRGPTSPRTTPTCFLQYPGDHRGSRRSAVFRPRRCLARPSSARTPRARGSAARFPRGTCGRRFRVSPSPFRPRSEAGRPPTHNRPSPRPT